MPVDQFDFWRRVLNNPKRLGSLDLPVTEQPQSGYWRVKNGNGQWIPIVYWFDADGIFRCQHGDKDVSSLDVMAGLWTRAVRNPISRKIYDHYIESGKWPDVDDVVAEQIADRSNVQGIEPEKILADQIAAALAQVDEYAVIGSDDDEKRAQSLRARLLELSKDGKSQHDLEKAPVLKVSKAIDAKWLPLVKDADDGSNTLRQAIAKYEKAKVDAAREEQRRKYQEELDAAMQHAMPPPVEPDLVEPEKVKGGYGRAASVRMKTVVDEITDVDRLFAFYKATSDVRDLLIKLANASLKKGVVPPGISTIEIADVR